MKENKVIAQLRHKKDNVNVDLTKLYPNIDIAGTWSDQSSKYLL